MKIPWTVGNYISDCPQKGWFKIDFTVNSNGLKQIIIKAGTKAYYPDGLDSNNNPKYGIYELPADTTTSTPANYTQLETVFLNISTGKVTTRKYSHQCLGSTYDITPNEDYVRWWDTTNNIIKDSTDKAQTFTTVPLTLPIGATHMVQGVGFVDFIPFTFTGCYGNGFFTLPYTRKTGNGFDSNFNPVNSEYTFTDIWQRTVTASTSYTDTVVGPMPSFLGFNRIGYNYFVQDDEPSTTVNSFWYQPKKNTLREYDTTTNAWKANSQNGRMMIARFSWNGTVKRVTEYQPYTTIDELAKYL